VVFLLWANCHGGVLLGLALLGVTLAARTIINRSRWPESALVLLACAAAMTVTPLGMGFWTEIPKSLSRISQYTLDEWRRPEFSEVALLPFWGITAAYLFGLVRRVRHVRDITASEATLHAPALALLVTALGAVRSVGPFLMIAVPALTHLWRLGEHRAPTTANGSKTRAVFNTAVMVTASLAVALTLTSAYRQGWQRLKWSPVSDDAVAALKRCPGNLYNRYDEGGMLLWFAPGRRVFLDGRQDPFPPELVLEHIEVETGARGYQPTFERFDIDCAFLPPTSPVASDLRANGWDAIFESREWVVFRKAGGG